jgi:fructose-1,6-bisphosphatase I
MYECHSLAFIAEQAGGKASTGTQRIMEVEPSNIHQTVPIFIGSKNMVLRAEELIKNAVKVV